MSEMKTGPVLDTSELPDGAMKAVPFEGGEVLLSRVNGKVHATSAHCTHYGAPLAKGNLGIGGRVTCPWHGACFNVCTGDIEDAPGLDSLFKYVAEERDGKIYVSAPEKELQAKVGRKIARARNPLAHSKGHTVVIVGGGSGGIHTIEGLRANDYAGDIVLLSRETYAPIDRTKLSKGLVDDATKVQWRTPEELRDDFGVDVRLGTTVTGVDTAKRTVITENGEVKYDSLVLSPGAVPRKIPIEGKDLDGVVTLRHVQDVQAITSALGPDADIVIIGTSFIGLEAAGAIAKKPHRSLTVVGVDEVPFEAMLGRDLGLALVRHFEGQGVTFHRGATVEKIAGENGKVSALHVKGMPPIPASLVIMGTGVAPATSFLKDTFELEKDGGVAVDTYLRVKGQENVYAIGDIAHYPQFPRGNVRRVEHWNVAGNHGRSVAATIAGKPTAYAQVPVFWSSVGKGLRYIGSGEEVARSWLDGSVDELKFVLYQANKNGEIVTVTSMGRDPIVAKTNELLRTGRMPSLDEIKAGRNVLEMQ
ncbi:hypothetical protein CC85DRAFT_285101 [Cutaneotrichosporon oleaginosum]|uniref:Rieske domain-containing protein n=1 Tax=Cutaneotrichosporon oleaginosum TaxID=879819 RepID=A0A0J0XPB5_9TREE|nr:uncharacterized protein CC85DRAFT_285101 [Cutaneotrichosporon oleaginosum]KLT42943.1 hypothetical protein CC85DRAFT_285101 [Cutaneotrichosporon oleaginosum]TXT12645.1 hypothetical protein COLE_03055 [Cutaneotrichosporon oleaginosum]